MKLPCRSASRLKAVTRPASGQVTAFACVEVVLSTQSSRPTVYVLNGSSLCRAAARRPADDPEPFICTNTCCSKAQDRGPIAE